MTDEHQPRARPGRPGARRRVVRAVAVACIVVVALTGPAWAGTQADGDAEAGEAVFRRNCAMCHGADATGMMGMHPALRGAAERLSREGVEVTVRNGRSTNPPMPAFGERLSDDEINDVVAYVASLPDGPRNFGPGSGSGMGGGMMDRMMDDATVWMPIVVLALATALAGLVGYLIGTRRGRAS